MRTFCVLHDDGDALLEDEVVEDLDGVGVFEQLHDLDLVEHGLGLIGLEDSRSSIRHGTALSVSTDCIYIGMFCL